MSTTYSNYSGPLIIINERDLALYEKKINTCSNKECDYHKKESKYNFCPECGSKIKELKINIEIPVYSYLRKKLGTLNDNISTRNIYDSRGSYLVILVEDCYQYSGVGQVVSVESILELTKKANKNEAYNKLLEILDNSNVQYSKKSSTVLIPS